MKSKINPDARIYPCRKCGVLRSKSEGGTTFTVCDSCWDIEASPMPNDAVVEAARRWRHTKRGTTYTEIGRGKMQTSDWVQEVISTRATLEQDISLQNVDMEEVVIYRADHDGLLWVRPVSEFEDGRFERIEDAPSPSDLAQVRAALEPFAEVANSFDADGRTLKDTDGIYANLAGDFRRAREALAILERAGV